MTEPDASADLTAVFVEDEAALRRRRFLRTGALLAAATGGAVVAGTATARPAAAADGDIVKVGGTYFGQNSTVLQTNDAGYAPLNLSNAKGPVMNLAPIDTWSGTTYAGDVISLHEGPKVGVDYGDGGQATYVATFLDLDALPEDVPITPDRILDTRSSSTRTNVVAMSSSSAIDSSGRLTKGSWLDVAIGSTSDEYLAKAAFVVVTSVGALADGYLAVYPPAATRPATITTSLLTGKQTSSATFVGTEVVKSSLAIRVYASQTTRVVLDLTGVKLQLNTEDVGNARSARARARAQRKAATRKSAKRG